MVFRYFVETAEHGVWFPSSSNTGALDFETKFHTGVSRGHRQWRCSVGDRWVSCVICIIYYLYFYHGSVAWLGYDLPYGRIPLFQQAANLVANLAFDLRERVESMSKACRKPARTCRKPGCKPGRKPGLQPGLQLARIIECGLYSPMYCGLWTKVATPTHAWRVSGICARHDVTNVRYRWRLRRWRHSTGASGVNLTWTLGDGSYGKKMDRPKVLKFFLIDYEQRDLATVYMRRERVTVAATKDKQRHCRLSVQPTYRLLLKTSSASAVCTNTEVVQCTTGVHVDVRSIPNKLCWLFAKITQIYRKL